ncbi:hypothetical protein [Sporosarcina ureilytica]
MNMGSFLEKALDMLRQPIESGVVVISRVWLRSIGVTVITI